MGVVLSACHNGDPTWIAIWVYVRREGFLPEADGREIDQSWVELLSGIVRLSAPSAPCASLHAMGGKVRRRPCRYTG